MTPGLIDNVSLGTLFGSFDQGSSVIGTLMFQIVSPPTVSGTSISFGNPQFVTTFITEVDAAEIRLTNTLITSPVPLPAAFWFFGTALIGLITVKKRRSELQSV